MRGFIIGLLLLVFVVISALSIRPGGIRNQLRNVVRRFKLALVLGGVYLLASAVLRLAFPSGNVAEIGMVVAGGALCITFLVLGQDRPLDQR